MSAITKEFTKEQLQQIIETDHVQCGEASSLARIALASLEAEAAITVGDDGGDALAYRRLIQTFAPGTKLYTAPPAPVSVPDEVCWEDVPEEITEDDMALASAWAHGFNQCRAAMLKHSEPFIVTSDHRMMEMPQVEVINAVTAMLQGAGPVQDESLAQHWYLVSWKAAGGTFGHADVGLDEPWARGSAQEAVELIAGAYPELQGKTIIIQSVMRIQPSECPPKQDESAQHPIICRSDERLMKTPDITDEAVKVIGSFNDNGFCHKHPDTPRLKHPYMQLMVYPPRPATYCPKCEPHVAEWEERDKQLRKSKGV
ncbi:hypothetical protein [Escherichia coli]